MAEDIPADLAPAHGPFDSYALIAALRKGDREHIGQAYHIVFGNELGRLVLADILAEAGVGARYGGKSNLYDAGYHQGGHDCACEIRDRAGFDQAATVLATMTGQLEGRNDETSAFAEPDPEID